MENYVSLKMENFINKEEEDSSFCPLNYEVTKTRVLSCAYRGIGLSKGHFLSCLLWITFRVHFVEQAEFDNTTCEKFPLFYTFFRRER